MRVSKAAIVLMLAAIPLAAQETRLVSGTVRDQEGRPLVGAVVQMQDMESLKTRSALTQQDGVYRFTAVSADADYRLQAKVGAYTGNVRHVSQYDHRPAAVVDLRVDTDWWRIRRSGGRAGR